MLFKKQKKQIITNEGAIEEALTRGVSDVLPTKEGLKKLLMSGKRITLYQGFDPTGTDLHIGHMVGFRKLAQFQKLGHRVIFLVGDSTGQAGDPSGKLKDRDTFYTREQLQNNAKEYLNQAGKIVDFKGDNPIEMRFNGDWLTELKLKDILNIAEQFTVQQLLERDMYQKRLKEGIPIGMREFLYPFLQGYDSVAMDVDLEIGGVDQTFNMLAGRTLQKRMNNREKFVLTTPLLADASGRKIGKTEGNVIGLTDEPEDIYGKIMALGDDVIVSGFEYLTDVPMDEVKNIERAVSSENPKKYKEQLAVDIVRQLHGEEASQKAQEQFTKIFAEGKTPDNIQMIEVSRGSTLSDTFVENNISASKSEFRRIVEQGGLHNIDTGETISDAKCVVDVPTITIKYGKRRFIKIKTK